MIVRRIRLHTKPLMARSLRAQVITGGSISLNLKVSGEVLSV